MSLYVTPIVKKNLPFSHIIKIYSKFSESIKSTKNNNSNYIELSFNRKHVKLNKTKLINELTKEISTICDKKTFKQSEREIQISSTINATIDEIQAAYFACPKKKHIAINSNNRDAIFEHVKKDCSLQASDVKTNASQRFIKQLLQNNAKVKDAIQNLKATTNNLDIEKNNADSKATTKYVIDTLNDAVCSDFFPDINFDKIRESATQKTRAELENKHYRALCQSIDSYRIMAEGTAV